MRTSVMKHTITKSANPLRAWRDEHGFTQDQAAEFLGISAQSYGLIERRATSPRASMLKKLIAKTGLSFDELVGAAIDAQSQ